MSEVTPPKNPGFWRRMFVAVIFVPCIALMLIALLLEAAKAAVRQLIEDWPEMIEVLESFGKAWKEDKR